MSKKESFWIPYADLMTVLMIVFLFISVGYMAIIEEQKKIIEQEAEKTKVLITEYQESKIALYRELEANFRNDFVKWNLELGKDLSIKFTNPDILFASGKSDLTDEFKSILKEFIPKYLDILLDSKFKDKIVEVRIEGHTDDVRIGLSGDDYIDNVELSQARARKVLACIRKLDYYKKLTSEQDERLKFLLTANGLSYGKTLDDDKKMTFNSKKEINRKNSRRVEFKIVTSSETVIDEVIKGL